MPNYNKCFIYKICGKDASITDCYIGSTTNIIRRRSQHKSSCTCISDKSYNQFVYTFIRSNGGWGNFDVIALEEFSCESKMQQIKKERDWIEILKPTLNKNIPANHQTGEVYDDKEYHKLYYIENKEVIKEYRDKNKETIKVKKAEYNEKNKETIKVNKAEYYDNNKEAIKEYNEKNKETIKVHRAEYVQKEILCTYCNHTINLSNRSHHNKTKKHISNSSPSNTPTISESDSD